MDLKNVLIIFNPKEFTKEQIKYDIKREGYKDRFAFEVDIEDDVKRSVVKCADEIWVFGNCTHMDTYKMALDVGADLWKMA